MTQGLQGPPRETFGFWDALGLLRLIFFFAIYAGYQYYNYGTMPFGLEKTIWHYTEKYIIGEKVPFEKQIPSNAPEQVSFVKLIDAARNEYRSAGNGMAEGGPPKARQTDLRLDA